LLTKGLLWFSRTRGSAIAMVFSKNYSKLKIAAIFLKVSLMLPSFRN